MIRPPASLARARAWHVAVLVGVFGVVALTACSSSTTPSPRPAASDCTWPASVDPVAAGYAITVGGAGGNQVLVYRASSAQPAGRCTVSGLVRTTVPFDDLTGAPVRAASVLSAAPPPVAGSTVTAVPDDVVPSDPGAVASALQGGVRDVPGGTRHALTFTGWAVVSTIGDRLLLERDPYVTSGQPFLRVLTDPAAWCVLPRVSAPLTQCTPVPGADVPGTASVTPAGEVRWVPLQPVPTTVAGVVGGLATDGAGVVAGFVPTGAGGTPYAASVDGRAVLLPGQDGPVQWATFGSGADALTATVHTAPVGTLRYRALPGDGGGFAVSADGHVMTAVVTDPATRACRVVHYHDDGTAPTTQTLPRTGTCDTLVAWPDPAADSSS